jgi:hypothetical protein
MQVSMSFKYGSSIFRVGHPYKTASSLILNEASESVRDTLKMFGIPLLKDVFGLRPLAESQSIL